MADAYIVEALRTAGGRRGGALRDWHPADLGAAVLDALLRVPAGHRLHVGGLDRAAVFVAQHVLEQYAQRVGQGLDIADLLLRERVEAVELDVPAADRDPCLASEAVLRHDSLGQIYQGCRALGSRGGWYREP